MLPVLVAVAAATLAPAAELQVKPSDWPQFRGLNRDAVAPEKGLMQSWPENGPPKAWTVSGLGGGYSTVAVVDGVIFGTGKRGNQEFLFALNEQDGSERWATPFADSRKVGYNEGTRSTPTYANGKVYAVACDGTLVCADATTGKQLWSVNFVHDFGGKVQAWGYSESVLVDEGKVIATPASPQAAMVALNADTGKLIWKTAVPNPGGAGGYASAVKTVVGGVPMYINLLGKTGGVVGVHAKTGKLLWQYTKIMNGTANIPSPIVSGDLVFASTGYADGGSALLKLIPSRTGVRVEELKYYTAKELQNHHGGMVLVDGYVYMGRGHNNGLPSCVELKTGKIMWAEDAGAFRGSGSAAVAYADNRLYFRYQNGVMALIAAKPKEYDPISAFKIPQPSGKPSWPHPTIANGKLYIRDQDKLHCYILKNPV